MFKSRVAYAFFCKCNLVDLISSLIQLWKDIAVQLFLDRLINNLINSLIFTGVYIFEFLVQKYVRYYSNFRYIFTLIQSYKTIRIYIVTKLFYNYYYSIISCIYTRF